MNIVSRIIKEEVDKYVSNIITEAQNSSVSSLFTQHKANIQHGFSKLLQSIKTPSTQQIMDGNVPLKMFTNNKLIPFVQNLIYALDRCIAKNTIEEAYNGNDWYKNTFGNTFYDGGNGRSKVGEFMQGVNDVGIYVPEFLRQGINAYAKTRMRYGMDAKRKGDSQKSKNAMASQVRLKDLMQRQYPKILKEYNVIANTKPFEPSVSIMMRYLESFNKNAFIPLVQQQSNLQQNQNGSQS